MGSKIKHRQFGNSSGKTDKRLPKNFNGENSWGDRKSFRRPKNESNNYKNYDANDYYDHEYD